MKKTIRAIAVAAVAAVLAPAAALATPTSVVPSALAGKAKISLALARQTALRAVPGKVASEELEREAGGLRYTFDIDTARGRREVGVDAITGRIIENSAETTSR